MAKSGIKKKASNREADDVEDEEGDNNQEEKTKSTTKKPREAPLDWKNNQTWTQHAIEYLTEKPHFRIRLFSDSTSEAKAEGCNKMQAKDGKAIQFAELAKGIFKTIPDIKVRDAYLENPQKYARSTQQHFSW